METVNRKVEAVDNQAKQVLKVLQEKMMPLISRLHAYQQEQQQQQQRQTGGSSERTLTATEMEPVTVGVFSAPSLLVVFLIAHFFRPFSLLSQCNWAISTQRCRMLSFPWRLLFQKAFRMRICLNVRTSLSRIIFCWLICLPLIQSSHGRAKSFSCRGRTESTLRSGCSSRQQRQVWYTLDGELCTWISIDVWIVYEDVHINSM